MGVTKTQIVKFIRKGDKGDAGENGITISLLPAALTPKVGVSSTMRVQVALYDGGRLIGYNDETDGNMICSTLPTSSAYKWTFRVESGKFYFVIMITPTDTTAISLPFTITYKGAKYDSVITIQPVANGAQGKQGATLRGPQAWSDCANGYSFQAGGDGDSWKDVVIYRNNYYSCIKSHTKTADNYPGSTAANNNKYWQLGDKIELVASKILLATYALVKNLGVEAIDMKDASGNIVFQAKDGNVICKNGTFENVKIKGSVRNPFTYANDSIDTDYSDNVVMISNGGGWIDAYSMPWGVEQSGRRITIVNYKWGSSTAQGVGAVSAPTGKYFYEDGIRKSELKFSREAIELLGYGTPTQFYGWIVLKRTDLMTAYRYGRGLKILAMGHVTSNGGITAKTFDGSKLTATHPAEGEYTISMPTNWFSSADDVGVILNGVGSVEGSSKAWGKPTLLTRATNSIKIGMSDDASANNAAFDFMIFNKNDWATI